MVFSRFVRAILSHFHVLWDVLHQSYWIIGSTAGALIGSLLSFNTKGIDFSMTALFIVVFIEQWKGTKNHLSAVLGVAASVMCLLLFGADRFLIPSMIEITVILAVMRKFMDKKEEGKENENE